MDKNEIIKLYQMLIHNINGLKVFESPSFSVDLLLKKVVSLLEKYKTTNEEYQNLYIHSIYENNEFYSLFKNKSDTNAHNLENQIQKLNDDFEKNLKAIEQKLQNIKKDGIVKYKQYENEYLPKTNFLNITKKGNKEDYIKNITAINKERILSNQNYQEIANDLASKNEQRKFQLKHSHEASIEQNELDKKQFLDFYFEQTDELENDLSLKTKQLEQEIHLKELLITDNTVLYNDRITKLNDEYEKRLQYAYIPYEIEQNKILDKIHEQEHYYSSFSEDILVEFKNYLQENDDEIEKERAKQTDEINKYKILIRKTSRQLSIELKKEINNFSKKIAELEAKYKYSRNKEEKLELRKLKQEKKAFIKKQTKENTKIINELNENYLQLQLKNIEVYEKLRSQKNKHEASKTNAMKNLNHENEFILKKLNAELQEFANEKSDYNSTEQYEEHIEVLKLRLERDIEKAKINYAINLIQIEINNHKFEYKNNYAKSLYEQQSKSDLADADLVYKNKLTENHINRSNVLAMLKTQKAAIKNKYDTLICNEKMDFEKEKMDFYINCDNLQYELFKLENEHKNIKIDSHIDYETKLAENEKKFLKIEVSLKERKEKVENNFINNGLKIKLYQDRFAVEKAMLNDAFNAFITNIIEVIEFENIFHKNVSNLSNDEFENNKKYIFIAMEYIRHIKSHLLNLYYERETTIINSRINFEKDLKYKKIFDNLQTENENHSKTILNRTEKLQETISSYQNTIKIFEQNIELLESENEKIDENIKVLKKNKNPKKEIAELKIKHQANSKFIETAQEQIKANERNIVELTKSLKKTIKDSLRVENVFHARLSSTRKALYKETILYTKVNNLIKRQYDKLKALIDRCTLYSKKRNFEYFSSSKNIGHVTTFNENLLDTINNYFEIHYIKLVTTITGEYNSLTETYKKNYDLNTRELDRRFEGEKQLHSIRINNINLDYDSNIKAIDKNYESQKTEILLKIKQINEEQLKKQQNHFNKLIELKYDLQYEISCHSDNLIMFEKEYANKDKEISHEYSRTVKKIRHKYQNNLKNLRTEWKHHIKVYEAQKTSESIICNNAINDLNIEYKQNLKNTRNKIFNINKNSKINKIINLKTQKNNLKEFKAEQKVIRKEFEIQCKEIDERCLKRIYKEQKEFLKKQKDKK